MEFLFEYGMFLAKFLTVLLLLLFAVAAVFLIANRAKGEPEHLNIKNTNDKYETMSFMLKSQVLNKKEFTMNDYLIL